MLKKKIIAFFLFLLLFVFFDNNISYCTAYAVNNRSDTNSYTVLKKAEKTDLSAGLSFNKPTAKKDNIRIRYMVGECSFDAAQFEVHISVPQFADISVNVANCFFIKDHCGFLFTLRGPPCC